MRLWMAAAVGPILVIAVLGACVNPEPYAVAPLPVSIASRAPIGTDSVFRNAVTHYVTYLDSLRLRNSQEARRELGKSNRLTLATMILGSVATVIALTSADDDDKARWSGITGAAATLGVGLRSQFRHGEDAVAYRACSALIEGMLLEFTFPSDPTVFAGKRAEHRQQLEALNCLAPLDF